MNETENAVRVRANVSTTTKGVYTFDVTSEAPDTETVRKNLSETIDIIHQVMAEKGYKEAGKEINA